MPKESQKSFTVSGEVLRDARGSSEVQLGILYSIFADKEAPSKEVLLSLCELYVLHSSWISYIDLVVRDSKVKDKDSYMLTTQDIYMMKTIRMGCDDLCDKLTLHNIFVAVN
tara:strand:+ start:1363 stop:1698 length:336 start_codon:yes stop_codon:yes gene_type:complete